MEPILGELWNIKPQQADGVFVKEVDIEEENDWDTGDKDSEEITEEMDELYFFSNRKVDQEGEDEEEEEEITCSVAVRGETEEKCGEIEEDIFLFPDAVKKQEER